MITTPSGLRTYTTTWDATHASGHTRDSVQPVKHQIQIYSRWTAVDPTWSMCSATGARIAPIRTASLPNSLDHFGS
jgi:hypothetical protein